MGEKEIEKIMNLIEKNQDKIIEQISQEDIDIYCFIQEEYKRLGSDLENNLIFRYIFKKYYLSSSARFFKDNSYKTFFSTFSKLNINNEDNINGIIEKTLLSLLPMRRNLEYSYTSKMIHTINSKYPIYDSFVKLALRMKDITGKNNDTKIKKIIENYTQISDLYDDIIKHNYLEKIINKFKKMRDISKLNIVKILDFLFWSAGKLIDKKEISVNLVNY